MNEMMNARTEPPDLPAHAGGGGLVSATPVEQGDAEVDRDPEPDQVVHIHCLSQIHPSEVPIVFIEKDSPQYIGAVERVVCSDSRYAVWAPHQGKQGGRFWFRYMIADAYSEWSSDEHKGDVADFNRLWIDVLATWQELTVLPDADKAAADSARDLLANAVASGLDLDPKAMAHGLASARSVIRGANRRAMTMTYVTSASAIAIATISVSVLVLVVLSLLGLSSESGPWVWIERILQALVGGSLGASISVLSPSGRRSNIDIMARKEHAVFEARSRVIFGMLCAVVVVFAVYSGVILDSAMSGPSLVLTAAIGGYAERFVPNILSGLAAAKNGVPDPKEKA